MGWACVKEGVDRSRSARGRGGQLRRKNIPPHLRNRNVWALIRLLDLVCWAPTRIFFHILVDVIVARVRHVWDEEDFVAYFIAEYMCRPADRVAGEAGEERLWRARW